jgi:hypothetical protein
MGKYSKALSNRMRVNRQVSPFIRVSAEKMMGDEQRWIKTENDKEFYEYYRTKEHWINDQYHVILDKECDDPRLVGTHLLDYPLWNMRIYRLDSAKIHDWCILQDIKSKIVGDEFEALELYPARSRHMDEGNCYHLWILAPREGETTPPKIPVGHVKESRRVILQADYGEMETKVREAFHRTNDRTESETFSSAAETATGVQQDWVRFLTL